MAVSGLIPGTKDWGISEGGGGILGSIVRAVAPWVQQMPSNARVYEQTQSGVQKLTPPPPVAPPPVQPPGSQPPGAPRTTSTQIPTQQQPQTQNVMNPPGVSSSTPQVDFDAIFGPQLAALSQAEQTAQASGKLQEQNILTEAEAQKRELVAQSENANKAYGASEAKAKSNLESALSDAIRSYNSLAQQNAARHGRGSSTGEAVSSIAQEAYYREQGKTQQSYAQIFNEIQSEWQDSLAKINRAQMEVSDWVSSELNNVRMWVADSLQNIQMAKAQTESEKAAQKMQVVDRAAQAAQAINQYKQQAQIQLDQWKEQQRFILENKLAPTYQNQPNTTGHTPQPQQNLTGTSASSLQSIRWNPKTAKWEDEFGNPVN